MVCRRGGFRRPTIGGGGQLMHRLNIRKNTISFRLCIKPDAHQIGRDIRTQLLERRIMVHRSPFARTGNVHLKLRTKCGVRPRV